MGDRGVRINGPKLAEIRRQKGMTGAVFAVEAGIGPSTLSLYENGRANPYPMKLAQIEKVIGLDAIEEVIGDEDAFLAYLGHESRRKLFPPKKKLRKLKRLKKSKLTK